MRRWASACCVLVLGLTGLSQAADAPATGPTKEIPELQVLQHYAGSWDCEIRVKPNDRQPKGGQTKGVSHGEWILDGRFFRQSWTAEGSDDIPGMKGNNVWTYDPEKETYRIWGFASNGGAVESRAKWDAKTKTMTSTILDSDKGVTVVTKATFPEEGTELWTTVIQDGAGQVLMEMSGKNVRRK